MTPREILNRHCEAKARERAARLEEEARVLLRMGFEVDELVVVHEQGWSDVEPQVVPRPPGERD